MYIPPNGAADSGKNRPPRFDTRARDGRGRRGAPSGRGSPAPDAQGRRSETLLDTRVAYLRVRRHDAIPDPDRPPRPVRPLAAGVDAPVARARDRGGRQRPGGLRRVERGNVGLVLSAVDPADPDALELTSYLRRKHTKVPVILLFANPSCDRAREATRLGAAVLRYPAPANELRATVTQALPGPGATTPRRRSRRPWPSRRPPPTTGRRPRSTPTGGCRRSGRATAPARARATAMAMACRSPCSTGPAPGPRRRGRRSSRSSAPRRGSASRSRWP